MLFRSSIRQYSVAPWEPTRLWAINFLALRSIRIQMLGRGTRWGDWPGENFSALALELLNRCGMISEASSQTSRVGYAGHCTLRFRFHYSLVILNNRLNLLAGCCV